MDKQTAKFVARIAENLPANMSDDVMQGWIENPRALQKFLADLCPPEMGLLTHHEAIVVGPLTKPLNPKEFFKTRTGLFVSSEFADRVLLVARPVEKVEATSLSSFTLTKGALDTEIRKALPEGHVFPDASIFCSYLAEMLNRQWDGTEGPLIVSGYSNLFYVKGRNGQVFVVFVYWFTEFRKWCVSAWRLDVDRWFAEGRVFSNNCLRAV